MKFRVKLTDPTLFQQFTNVISTLAKFSKSCVMHLTTDAMAFIVSDEQSVNHGPIAWTTLRQEQYFNYYKMEGISPEDNEIFMEVSSSMLVNALKSSSNAKYFKIKLTNKQFPCLTLAVDLSAGTCIHDIPVDLIPRREWPNFEIPALYKSDISVVLPDLKRLKAIVERMKNFSAALHLTVDSGGVLILKVEDGSVKIANVFKNLHVQQIAETVIKANASIYIKNFILFLNVDHMHPSRVVCNVIDGGMVHMAVNFEGSEMHYFLPTLIV